MTSNVLMLNHKQNRHLKCTFLVPHLDKCDLDENLRRRTWALLCKMSVAGVENIYRM
jgi:hypothetical protein